MAMTTEEFFHSLYRIEMRRHQGSIYQSTRAANAHVAHWLGGSRRIAAWTNERERSHMAPRHVLDASPTSGRITVPTWRRLGMKSYSDTSRKEFAKNLRGAEVRTSSNGSPLEKCRHGCGPFWPLAVTSWV
ncbi:hypothetical protein CMUS01_01220 [Colletotrichum musicola]|uniref:Uncharacterized protein n=1 Tax=Colletotrichum musicola TaxID=2175873 RepID=A0A8H6NXB1_9PEZI|nr:hypothetical protein CMUS01_01220 [Colletotrichum musicola]